MSKTCNGCRTEEMAIMPIAQHEKDQSRLMSIIKWLIAVVVVLIVLLVGSNVGWLIYESQFETVESTMEEYEIKQNAEYGDNNSIINGGEIVNGYTND
jgi:multisubunit Na+/H+ antiporter MnhB subunit